VQEIKITISDGGSVQVGVKGVKGKSCTELTKELEKALGKTASQKLTGEYHLKEEIARIKLGRK